MSELDKEPCKARERTCKEERNQELEREHTRAREREHASIREWTYQS
jgi:hypothetical protein